MIGHGCGEVFFNTEQLKTERVRTLFIMSTRIISCAALTDYLETMGQTDWASILTGEPIESCGHTIVTEGILHEFIGDDPIAPIRLMGPRAEMKAPRWSLPEAARPLPEAHRYSFTRDAYEIRWRHKYLVNLAMLVRLSRNSRIDLGHPLLTDLVETILEVHRTAAVGSSASTFCKMFLRDSNAAVYFSPPLHRRTRICVDGSGRGVRMAIMHETYAEVARAVESVTTRGVSGCSHLSSVIGMYDNKLYIHAPDAAAVFTFCRAFRGQFCGRYPSLVFDSIPHRYRFCVDNDRLVWILDCEERHRTVFAHHLKTYLKQIPTHASLASQTEACEHVTTDTSRILTIFDLSQASAESNCLFSEWASYVYNPSAADCRQYVEEISVKIAEVAKRMVDYRVALRADDTSCTAKDIELWKLESYARIDKAMKKRAKIIRKICAT